MPRDSIEPPLADGTPFSLAGALVRARASGALWAPELNLLAVADLHLGKAERLARRGGALLPPYAERETLARLTAEIETLAHGTVVCVGDSFYDARAAEGLGPEACAAVARLAEGRRWIWIAGNHDPAPHGQPGLCAETWRAGPLSFRHTPASCVEAGEVAGHLHPKATLALPGRRLRRRCFLRDARRVILPAFGAFTGGIDVTDPLFDALVGPDAQAMLLGRRVVVAPRAALSR